MFHNLQVSIFGLSSCTYFLFFLQIDKELATGEYFLKAGEKKAKKMQEIKVCHLRKKNYFVIISLFKNDNG